MLVLKCFATFSAFKFTVACWLHDVSLLDRGRRNLVRYNTQQNNLYTAFIHATIMALIVPWFAKEKNRHFQPLNTSEWSWFFLPSGNSNKRQLNHLQLKRLKCNQLSPFSFLFSSFCSFYLIPSTLVSRHVPFEQSAVKEAAAAFRAAKGILGLLMAVPDVLLQWAVALVAARAVWAGE